MRPEFFVSFFPLCDTSAVADFHTKQINRSIIPAKLGNFVDMQKLMRYFVKAVRWNSEPFRKLIDKAVSSTCEISKKFHKKS